MQVKDRSLEPNDIAKADVVSVGSREPLVRLHDVSFAYSDGTEAVRSLSLDLEKGSVTSIVGPSGCGKSTLLSLVAGLLKPNAGSVTWSSEQASMSDGRRSPPFTMVFQKDTLLPWLTVQGNVAFSLRYLPLSRQERQERLRMLMQLGRLDEFKHAYPYQLSGGMRRRVALLSSVAPLPKMLLLDEPFSALDEPTRVALHHDVLSIVYSLGMTVLLVTHDLGEAVSVSDTVHILTRRPATIAGSQQIGFGHDRDPLSLRETVEYQELYRHLWSKLREQIVPAEDEPADDAVPRPVLGDGLQKEW